MVAAPLLTSTVPIDLPNANVAAAAADTKPLEISVNRAGEIWIGDEAYQSPKSCQSCRLSPRPAMTSAF
jgi:biopolymer transport protein TolR